MNGKLRLGLVSLNQTPLDWIGNMRRIREAWARARKGGARLVCFPELVVSGYGCEDMFLHRDTGQRALRLTRELARECGDEVALVGLPFWLGDHLFNGVAVLNRGKIRGITAKSHLARDGIHYEPRWFRAWPEGASETLDLGGQEIPVGLLTYNANGLGFALEICEDAWVSPAQRPCRLYRDVHWIFNASASHFSMRKAHIRERIVSESSRRFRVGYAYANLVGCESGRAIYDGELLIAQNGEIVNRSDCLYLDDARVLIHDLLYSPTTNPAGISLHVTTPPTTPPAPRPVCVRKAVTPEQEFALAASLALFDYMRKSRSFGFTLSLSGGVDSSTVAVLVWITARRVLTELTLQERESKLDYFSGLILATGDERHLVSQWLTTVYQATRNSGAVTRKAAAELARTIGARHLELDVDSMVEGYKRLVGNAVGRRLDWETDDVTLQNIQARVRAPGVWMLANLQRSLLLTTSNRSEVAVGYATMDGDTCGGLAPIAGVEKSFLRSWLVMMAEQGLPGLSPIPALALVNNQQPTAELRPPEQAQTDERDLMPYAVLDALEEALIAQRLTPTAAFECVCSQFTGRWSQDRIRQWTRKFCRMFAVSQWKRERYAPAFHLDDRNLDPKTWARYPILSGAFEMELEEL